MERGCCFGCSTFCQQLNVLNRKNYLLKIRAPLWLIAELVIPIAFMLAMIGLKSSVSAKHPAEFIPTLNDSSPTTPIEDMYFNPECDRENLVWRCLLSRNSNCQRGRGCQPKYIVVAPSNDDPNTVASAVDLFDHLNGTVNLNGTSPFLYMNSESDFIDKIGASDYGKGSGNIYSAGVIVQSGYPNWNVVFRFNQSYHVRVKAGTNGVTSYNMPSTADSNFDITLRTSSDTPNRGQPYLDAYVNIGYFTLSDLVNTYVVTSSCNSSGHCNNGEDVVLSVPTIMPFPNKKITTLLFWSQLGSIFALLMILALLMPVFYVVSALVQEKETKIREGLMMMSCRADALWTAWIIHFQALFIPLAIILTIVGANLFQYSDSTLIFFYFWLYFTSSMALCILLHTFFSSSRMAAIVGTGFFFVGYIIFIAMQNQNASTGALMAASLHPATAFTFGTLAFSEYEDSTIGVTKYTWSTSTTYNITFQQTLVMMIIDTIYLSILAWYFSNVSSSSSPLPLSLILLYSLGVAIGVRHREAMVLFPQLE